MKAIFIFIMGIHLINGSAGCASCKNTTAQIDWRIAGKLPTIDGTQHGVAGASAGVHNNIMLVGGGANFPDSMPWMGGKKKYHATVYAFSRTSDGRFVAMNDMFTLAYPIAYAATGTTTKGIVCAGGENDHGITNKVFLLQWDEGKKNINTTSLPSLPYPLTNACITSGNDVVYVAGGEMGDDVSDKFLRLDLNDTASGWKSLPVLPHAVSHAMLVFVNEKAGDGIYLIGGRRKNLQDTSTLYKDVYRYDVNELKWTVEHSLPYALSAATALASDKSIFVIGGDQGMTFHKTESVIAAMNAAESAAEKHALSLQKAAIQSAHPGFSNKILEYNIVSGQWTVIDSIPFTIPVTTPAFRWKDDIILPSGEIRAGVRTPDILAGRMVNGEW